ncbi:MAG: hypothetical protein H0X08_01645 [Blastocatellia bacterium]|nr:hypothetical protein [Blastocatellia bacterium]
MSEEVTQSSEEPITEVAAPAAESQEATETPAEPAVEPEDVSYQAVEKDGTVTAIWEMQGRKHLRTIDPRSPEGKQILALFETAA